MFTPAAQLAAQHAVCMRRGNFVLVQGPPQMQMWAASRKKSGSCSPGELVSCHNLDSRSSCLVRRRVHATVGRRSHANTLPLDWQDSRPQDERRPSSTSLNGGRVQKLL